MCVEVFWILISDAGSTPATSTGYKKRNALNPYEQRAGGIFNM